LDETEKELWILERLLEGNDPIAHPARVRYFPDNQSWQMALGSLATRRLITKRVPPTLTKSGEQYIRNKLYLNPVGPAALPFQIITMPIASGDVVVKGGLTWEDLATQGVRTVTGLEMEAATIANIAYLAEKDWFVAKGVMDYANPRKTDRYKRFAASASAEVLFRFMSKHLCRVPADAKRRSASVRSVYIVGGVTGETNYTSFEQTQLGDVCRQLGEGIARAGAELVVCSPFADSADHYAVLGYVRSGMGRAVHFHRPRHESVDRKQEELLAMLGATSVRFVYWDYPGPHNDEDWGQAWMLSQLMALERSDAVVAIGGRTSKSAWTLLHLADSRRKIIVPFSFLGGASARIFDVKDWGGLYPGFDQNRLTRRESVAEAMEIVNMFASASFVDTRGSVWPPRTIFISRARTDSRHADALAGHLEKAGYRVVMGDEQVRTERMTTSAIEDAVLRSDLFIALWSSEYAMSVFCHDELELALVRRSLGHTNVAIFSLDGTQVVQRSARNLPCLVVESTEVLVSAVMEVLDGPVPRPNDRMTPSAPEFKPID
jgi:hypothetical protein